MREIFRGDTMDLLNTKAFNALESGLNAQWIQAQASLQNLANIETPGYKTKNVSFGDLYRNAVNNTEGKYAFRAVVTTDNTTLARPDGNNVNSDTESTKLYRAYIQSGMIQQKITGSITGIKYVLENGPR